MNETKTKLEKLKERLEIVQCLLDAKDYLEEILKIIMMTEDHAEINEQLPAKLHINEFQAQAIMDMRLRAFSKMERGKLKDEICFLQGSIEELEKAAKMDEIMREGSRIQAFRDRIAKGEPEAVMQVKDVMDV